MSTRIECGHAPATHADTSVSVDVAAHLAPSAYPPVSPLPQPRGRGPAHRRAQAAPELPAAVELSVSELRTLFSDLLLDDECGPASLARSAECSRSTVHALAMQCTAVAATLTRVESAGNDAILAVTPSDPRAQGVAEAARAAILAANEVCRIGEGDSDQDALLVSRALDAFAALARACSLAPVLSAQPPFGHLRYIPHALGVRAAEILRERNLYRSA